MIVNASGILGVLNSFPGYQIVGSKSWPVMVAHRCRFDEASWIRLPLSKRMFEQNRQQSTLAISIKSI